MPRLEGAKFAWKNGYSFLRAPEIRARRFFALEGRLNGLGYMVNSEGVEVASPVVVSDHTSLGSRANSMTGSRIAMLDFEPEAGYWESPDGFSLVREAAFRDLTSGKQFSGTLDPGRAALLLIGEDGALLAAYNWKAH